MSDEATDRGRNAGEPREDRRAQTPVRYSKELEADLAAEARHGGTLGEGMELELRKLREEEGVKVEEATADPEGEVKAEVVWRSPTREEVLEGLRRARGAGSFSAAAIERAVAYLETDPAEDTNAAKMEAMAKALDQEAAVRMLRDKESR